jgi:hypothetical protein
MESYLVAAKIIIGKQGELAGERGGSQGGYHRGCGNKSFHVESPSIVNGLFLRRRPSV